MRSPTSTTAQPAPNLTMHRRAFLAASATAAAATAILVSVRRGTRER